MLQQALWPRQQLAKPGLTWNMRFPFAKEFSSTARDLNWTEVEIVTSFGFYNYMGLHSDTKIPWQNPITIDGKIIEKIPSTNPNIEKFENVDKFRSGFYNANGYPVSLEEKTGVFVSQGLNFKEQKYADKYKELMLKESFPYCKVVLEKGKTIAAVNMIKTGVVPPQEFWQLVTYATKNGFKSTVGEYCAKS